MTIKKTKAPAAKKPEAKKTVKKTAVKKSATNTVAKKAPAKKSATKKVAKKVPAKKSATNTVAKKAPAKKSATNTVAKKAPAKKSATNTVAKKVPAKKSATKKAAKAVPLVKNPSVAREGEAASKKAAPIAFSFDDVEALVATRKKETKSVPEAPAKKKDVPVKKKTTVVDKPVEKRVLGAASLADILGFNPAEKKKVTSLEDESIPKKWKKYYKLLLDLRQHVSDELDLHTSNTLQHASRDEGDHKLESDAGTDAFDRDFALSLVSSEQEALNEVEEAIIRIKDGTYGVCEVTGKTISKERLAAVPFARYSIEGQAEFEKNQRRKIERNTGGLFADSADAPKITSDDED
ncbi:MAG: TraR/DksA C4-type zinc finger protein [Opitutales bacterium]|jgi:RNA polymerase-binding transcription factor DksA